MRDYLTHRLSQSRVTRAFLPESAKSHSRSEQHDRSGSKSSSSSTGSSSRVQSKSPQRPDHRSQAESTTAAGYLNEDYYYQEQDDSIASFPRRFSKFYEHCYLPRRKSRWTKLGVFFGTNFAVWIFVWGIYGGFIAQWWKAVLIGSGVRTVIVWGTALAFEARPSLTEHFGYPLWTVFCDVRLWWECVSGVHDVWPHFGDIEKGD
mmetsp:Transcript_9301/g.22860  ORF Transcript_9301/g.22860 Transcript_9301/m.22860 type:complete len:205 (+) Transcript_9301:379-993(+)|eukprot:g5729.t1